MNQFYDNHANDIEYFDIQVKKKSDPKPVSKKQNIKIEELTDDELFDKHIEVITSFQEMSELYQNTKNQKVLNRLERLSTFKTVIQIAMRKRKISTYSQINLKLAAAEKKVRSVLDDNENSKIIARLNGEIANYKKLLQDQKDQNATTKEVEKTKRHEISSSRELLIHKEFKNLIYSEFGDYEYHRLISKACEIVDNK